MKATNSPDTSSLNKIAKLLQQGRFDEAIQSGLDLAQRFPQDSGIHCLLGDCYRSAGQTKEALTSYAQALALDARDANAVVGAANASARLGLDDDALRYYEIALQLMPDNAAILYNKANILLRKGQNGEAEKLFRQTVALDPSSFRAWNNLGLVLYEKGSNDEALASFEKSVALNDKVAEVHRNLGNVLNDMGRLEQARQCLEQAIALNPALARAHQSLSGMKKYQAGDAQIETMQALLNEPQTSLGDRAALGFALFKAYDDLHLFDQAFNHLAEANLARKKLGNYQVSQDQQLFAHIPKAFRALPARAGQGSEAEPETVSPVFVVGMPRSGTTLLEQILGSHSQVSPGGELEFLNAAMSRSKILQQPASPDSVKMLRETYLSALTTLQAAQSIIVDKMPANFRWLGFIRAAMPQAKVLHMRRDPIAVCWSNFQQDFVKAGNGYSFDLEDIAAYYRCYRKLMDFWTGELGDWFYTVDYEKLTADPEAELLKVFEFLELPWESRCLEFHQLERAVKTASVGQVREKIYTGSSDAWCRYETHLQGLTRQLSELLQ